MTAIKEYNGMMEEKEKSRENMILERISERNNENSCDE
jgi:hypothetical protein